MINLQMAMKDGSDDLLSRTKLLSLELLQVWSCVYRWWYFMNLPRPFDHSFGGTVFNHLNMNFVGCAGMSGKRESCPHCKLPFHGSCESLPMLCLVEVLRFSNRCSFSGWWWKFVSSIVFLRTSSRWYGSVDNQILLVTPAFAKISSLSDMLKGRLLTC